MSGFELGILVLCSSFLYAPYMIAAVGVVGSSTSVIGARSGSSLTPGIQEGYALLGCMNTSAGVCS